MPSAVIDGIETNYELRGEGPPWRKELYFEFGYVRALRTETLKYVERGDG